MNIDVLIPSRGRPYRLQLCLESLYSSCTYPERISTYVYLDKSDISLKDYNLRLLDECDINYQIGNGAILSELWNLLFDMGQSEIVMHCSDDIIFETEKWDEYVCKYFESLPDMIGLIYGDDGHHRQNCATHSFTSRIAANALDYFCPPYFEADWNDVWLMQMYRKINRIKYEPKIITRHNHVNVDQSYMDETYRLAEKRRQRASKVWDERKDEIDLGAAILQDTINETITGLN